MKKIYKYKKNVIPNSNKEAFDDYRKLSKVLRRNGKKSLPSKSNPLGIIMPFVAASLTPFAINAQCGVAQITNGPGAGADGQHLLIDIDGDGDTDFELDVALLGNTDLFIGVRGGAEVLAAPVGGGYFYNTRFAASNVISSANGNWQGSASLPSGGGLGIPQATLDYNANGNWAGTGVVTGFVGIRIDGNRLGFMEVTWDNNATVTVDASTMGVQSVAEAGTMSITAGSCDVLPVELVKFNGVLNKSKVILDWSTATESNNKGFVIERSTDGTHFSAIGYVQGQGDSNVNIDYQFIDENIRPNRKYYYRLKQEDFWQGHSLSEVIVLETEKTIDFNISPNPISGENLRLEFNGEKTQKRSYVILNSQGMKILEDQNLVDDVSYISTEGLVPGAYFLKIQSDGNSDFRKFIVQ